MIRRLPSIILAFCLAGVAYAQTPPYVCPITLGTSSVSILPFDPARKRVIFHNPNDQAKVAVCPVGPTRVAQGSQSLIVAAIKGAGCITLLPYQSQEISGSTASGPQQYMPTAWVGIASAPASALSIYEFE